MKALGLVVSDKKIFENCILCSGELKIQKSTFLIEKIVFLENKNLK